MNEVSESIFSSVVSTTPTGTPDPTATAPGAPQSLTATPGVNFVELSWAAPASDGGSWITSYRVYRGTQICEYTLLAVVMETSYNDTSIEEETTYYYMVTAVNGLGESPFSNEVSTTPLGRPEKSSESQDSAAPSFIATFLFLVGVVVVSRKRKES